MMQNSSSPVDILLVEDNAGDVRLTAEALKEAQVAHTLHVAGDGVEALDFLHRRGAHASAPRPELVLLDLNIPRRDGRQVLADIKSDPTLCSIPVVVLTTSQREQDVLASYQLHANCYIVKPVNLDQFMTAMQAIEDFWLKTVRLPGLDGAGSSP